MKICKECNIEKPLSSFWFSDKSKGYRKSRCIDCLTISNSIRSKKYYYKHKERIIENIRKYKDQNPDVHLKSCRKHFNNIKMQAFDLLGNKCVMCPIDNIELLHIDHINGGGLQERKKLSQAQLYRKILFDPDPYQLLCANCNWRKREDYKNRSELTRNLRNMAIEKYGSHCVECGESDAEVLQFDHIDCDGNNNHSQRVMSIRYRKYINNDVRMQLLCCNCHHLKNLLIMRY